MKCRLSPHLAHPLNQHPSQQQRQPQPQQQWRTPSWSTPVNPRSQQPPPAAVDGTDWLRMDGQMNTGGSYKPPMQQQPQPQQQQPQQAPPPPFRVPPPPRTFPGSAYSSTSSGIHRTA